MVDFPATLDEAVEQAKTATKAAQYLQAFTEFGASLKVSLAMRERLP